MMSEMSEDGKPIAGLFAPGSTAIRSRSATEHSAATVISSGHVARPELCSDDDRSIVETVAGLIQEYSSGSPQPMASETSGSSHTRPMRPILPDDMALPIMSDDSDHVVWARFESMTDINDAKLLASEAELQGYSTPLILVIGYTSCVQFWMVGANNEAREICVYAHDPVSSVQVIKLLPTPMVSDHYVDSRPVVALVEATSQSGYPGHRLVKFYSLRGHKQIHSIEFGASDVCSVEANRRIICITCPGKLAIFHAGSLGPLHSVTSCYLLRSVSSFGQPDLIADAVSGVENPVAIGDRWLAYADIKLDSVYKSIGGMSFDSNSSRSAVSWSIDVGSKLAKGVSKLYNSWFTSPNEFAGHTVSAHYDVHQPRMVAHAQPHCHPHNVRMSADVSSQYRRHSSECEPSDGGSNVPTKGVVTIMDTAALTSGQSASGHCRTSLIVAHFQAQAKAIVAMHFNDNGSLILTCDERGSYFNLYKICPASVHGHHDVTASPGGKSSAPGPKFVNPNSSLVDSLSRDEAVSSSLSRVQHLYALYRGDTLATVQDISFSADSRWVSVSTARGTSHVFSISHCGGPINVRSHASGRINNHIGYHSQSSSVNNSCSGTRQRHPSGGRSWTVGHDQSLVSVAKLCGGSSQSLMSTSPSQKDIISTAVDGYGLAKSANKMDNVIIVEPAVQLRQPYLLSLTSQAFDQYPASYGSKSAVGLHLDYSSDRQQKNSRHAVGVPVRLATLFSGPRLLGPSLFHQSSSVDGHVVNRGSSRWWRSRRSQPSLSLYVVTSRGCLVEYAMEVRPHSDIPHEKVSEWSPIEACLRQVGQWQLAAPPTSLHIRLVAPDMTLDTSPDIPFPIDSPILAPSLSSTYSVGSQRRRMTSDGGHMAPDVSETTGNEWLAEVEIDTHSGPNRRLWMGPQFKFVTYSLQQSNSRQSKLTYCPVEVCMPGSPTAGLDDVHSRRRNPSSGVASKPEEVAAIQSEIADAISESDANAMPQLTTITKEMLLPVVQKSSNSKSAKKKSKHAPSKLSQVVTIPPAKALDSTPERPQPRVNDQFLLNDAIDDEGMTMEFSEITNRIPTDRVDDHADAILRSIEDAESKYDETLTDEHPTASQVVSSPPTLGMSQRDSAIDIEDSFRLSDDEDEAVETKDGWALEVEEAGLHDVLNQALAVNTSDLDDLLLDLEVTAKQTATSSSEHSSPNPRKSKKQGNSKKKRRK